MNETGPPPTSVVPSAPPAGPAAPPPPAAPARRPFLGRLAGAFLFLLRRPGRTAVVVVLTALIGVGAWMVGVQAWGHYQLEAARRAVERYHNRQARDHLQAYLKVWPHDAAALLLAARTARRTGAFAEAEDLLNSYEGSRGKDDQDLILERVLLQAQRGRVDKVGAFCLARVRDNDPSAPLVLEAQTAGLLRTYRVVEADERMKTWLKLKPDDCQALLFQGIWYDLRGQTPEASANYRRVIDLDPENEEARMRLTALCGVLYGDHWDEYWDDRDKQTP
jgi:tetratricopeptide (TPR) repeat protein